MTLSPVMTQAAVPKPGRRGCLPALLVALLLGIAALPMLLAAGARDLDWRMAAFDRQINLSQPVTPPRAVVVADGQVQVGNLRLEVPAGWHVNTGEADAPLRLILAAPDRDAAPACALILLQAEAMNETPTPPGCDAALLRSATRTDGGIAFALIAPRAAWGEYAPVFARVVASVQGEPPG